MYQNVHGPCFNAPNNPKKNFNALRIQVLKPSDKAQTEMIIASLVEIFLRLSEGGTATFCLPGSDNCFEPTATFAIDGATEKVRLSTGTSPRGSVVYFYQRLGALHSKF